MEEGNVPLDKLVLSCGGLIVLAVVHTHVVGSVDSIKSSMMCRDKWSEKGRGGNRKTERKKESDYP